MFPFGLSAFSRQRRPHTDASAIRRRRRRRSSNQRKEEKTDSRLLDDDVIYGYCRFVSCCCFGRGRTTVHIPHLGLSHAEHTKRRSGCYSTAKHACNLFAAAVCTDVGVPSDWRYPYKNTHTNGRAQRALQVASGNGRKELGERGKKCLWRKSSRTDKRRATAATAFRTNYRGWKIAHINFRMERANECKSLRRWDRARPKEE